MTMNVDERNTQLLIEQICGPLDEILALYNGGLRPAHAQTLTQCRDLLEQILLDYDADPDNPDVVHDEND
jgi:hypothetical protein